MEGYKKGEVKEVKEAEDDEGCHGGTADTEEKDKSIVHMRVNAGSKIPNLINYAIKALKDPVVQRLTWNASGQAITKAITCAEITKRKTKGLYQTTTLKFKRIEEYWEPTTEGLERLKVNRDVPAVNILLSKEPLDPSTLGYQGPGSCDILNRSSTEQGAAASERKAQQSAKSKKRKRNPRTFSASASVTVQSSRSAMEKSKDVRTESTSKES